MKQEKGFSLLEVAIALGVLAVGLSGLCALLIKSAAGASLVSHRTHAHWLMQRLESELSLVPDATAALSSAPPLPAQCTPDSPCLPLEFAADSVARWMDAVDRTLPSGHGRVCRDETPDDGAPDNWACDGNGNLVIKVAWREAGTSADWAIVSRTLRP
jgi:type IV pilus assembly protein PilV